MREPSADLAPFGRWCLSQAQPRMREFWLFWRKLRECWVNREEHNREVEVIGSSGRTRTYNPSVNSRRQPVLECLGSNLQDLRGSRELRYGQIHPPENEPESDIVLTHRSQCV